MQCQSLIKDITEITNDIKAYQQRTIYLENLKRNNNTTQENINIYNEIKINKEDIKEFSKTLDSWKRNFDILKTDIENRSNQLKSIEQQIKFLDEELKVAEKEITKQTVYYHLKTNFDEYDKAWPAISGSKKSLGF